MKNHEMSQEEIDGMLKSMDKDGDGLCDYCGMSVETCRKMMTL
jgi:Ca2+-binding EF-hand superfamily protein